MPRHQILDESDYPAVPGPSPLANALAWALVAGVAVLAVLLILLVWNDPSSSIQTIFILGVFALGSLILLLSPLALVYLYRREVAEWTEDGRPPPILPALGRGLIAVVLAPVRFARWCRRVPAEVREAAHEMAQPVNEAIQRCGDNVEEFILNCRPAAAPEGTFPSPDDDTPLEPLDRKRFLAALQDRFAVAVVQIADAVERARTVRELAQYNAQVGAVLGALHDEVLREVVRQQPTESVTAPVPSRPAEPAPRRRRRKVEQAVEFPGAWARKYRGMRTNER